MKHDKPILPAGEQEAAEAVAAVAAAAADGGATEVGDDFFEELAELQRQGSSEKSFVDGRALLETEHLEQLGVWRDIPFLAGAALLIAHMTVAAEKRESLEAKFREKYKVPIDQPITGKSREAIWREAYYGTVVKDWRGVTLDGNVFDFTAENFRTLMTSRRFRQFIIQASTDAEAFRAERVGKLRGNS